MQPGGAPEHQSRYKEVEPPTPPQSFLLTQAGGQALHGASGGSPTPEMESTQGDPEHSRSRRRSATPQQSLGPPLTRVLRQGPLRGGGEELPCGPLALMEVAESRLYYLSA